MNLQEIVTKRCGKSIADCSNEELYYSLLEMTKGMAKEKESNAGKRKLYYISAEFLIGKLLSNNLINLGIYDDVAKFLKENGKEIAAIEEVEPEPSLGNGGLGRLAACFLDSLATLNLPGEEDELLRNRPLCYRPVLRLDEDLDVSLKKMEEMGRVLSSLPGIDCGVCGAPNCRAFAEDIVKGLATERECILYTVK